MTPNMPIPNRKIATEETAMMGLRKSQSGKSGSAARCSVNRNATSIIPAKISKGITRCDSQPYGDTQVSASNKGIRQALSVNTPSQSIWRRTPCGRKYGNSTRTAPAASAPTGKFTQKVQRQENSSVIQPPSVGPKIEAIPQTAANNP